VENYRWSAGSGESRFAEAAASVDGCLPLMPRRGMHIITIIIIIIIIVVVVVVIIIIIIIMALQPLGAGIVQSV
jgi:hypothetical protein